MVVVALVEVERKSQGDAMVWEAWHGRGWQEQVSLDGRSTGCQEGEHVDAKAWHS